MTKDDQTERTRSFFDTASSGWTARYEKIKSVSARKSRFLNVIQTQFFSTAQILDFGCGSGDIAIHLSTAGHRVTGYDLSASMIAQARKNDSDRRVQWIVRVPSDSHVLPFADATFDAVVASSVLEYVPDVEATLAQLGRVLRPGGWLFATVPDMRDPHRRHEHRLRWASNLFGLKTILDHTRWREGAAYLRISVNRMPYSVWEQSLRATGFEPEIPPEPSNPLMMLKARKYRTANELPFIKNKTLASTARPIK